jgi:hypothetical protein
MAVEHVTALMRVLRSAIFCCRRWLVTASSDAGLVAQHAVVSVTLALTLVCSLVACSAGHATPSSDAPSEGASSAPGTVLVARELNAAAGGTIRASNGVQLRVPAHVMKRSGIVRITSVGQGVYDLQILASWSGQVIVTIPLEGYGDKVMHEIGGYWVPESDKVGQGTVRVDHLSPFSALSNLASKAVGAASNFLCIKPTVHLFLECLLEKGLSKINSDLAHWLLGKLSSTCAGALFVDGVGGSPVDVALGALTEPACIGSAGGPGSPPTGIGTNTGSNSSPSTSESPGSVGAPPTDCEALVADLTVPDGTAVSPGQTFNKAWRLRNCGTTNWSSLTAVRVAGVYGPASFPVPTIAPGSTADVTITVTAPTQPGLSRATYRLQAPDGHYASNSFWVEVNVVTAAPGNRQAVTSYDQMRPGAPYHGYFTTAWQPFIAASNTITWISATVGNPAATAGAPVQGSALTLRICTDPSCSVIIAETHPNIVNYGETGADIGDVAVTQGTTYYLVWYQPPTINGSTWVTYWWAGGNTISTSDSMEAAVRGYQR